MKGERAVTGVLRWKDVGCYLLLSGDGSLDDPVERPQNPAVEVLYTRPFLDIIPGIIKHGYLLVRGPKDTIAGLSRVRNLRNSVMHFHPDGTNDDDRRQLSHFLELIYDLQRFAKR